ncbi:MAG TPA: 50S ribosomal protein L21 [Candidatus Hydrogenedentes bacterium]|nr:50S ribosomal protein L21 [Candidatus Hydrogenedentota bacterium]
MYAVLATGGKQVKISEGDTVRVEKIDAPVGDLIELGNVKLLVADSGVVSDGQTLGAAKVVCEVTAQGRRKKIRVFKKKRRKNYVRTQGHRQSFTELRIKQILAGDEAADALVVDVQDDESPEAVAETKPAEQAEDVTAAPEPEVEAETLVSEEVPATGDEDTNTDEHTED